MIAGYRSLLFSPQTNRSVRYRNHETFLKRIPLYEISRTNLFVSQDLYAFDITELLHSFDHFSLGIKTTYTGKYFSQVDLEKLCQNADYLRKVKNFLANSDPVFQLSKKTTHEFKRLSEGSPIINPVTAHPNTDNRRHEAFFRFYQYYQKMTPQEKSALQTSPFVNAQCHIFGLTSFEDFFVKAFETCFGGLSGLTSRIENLVTKYQELSQVVDHQRPLRYSH